MKRIGLSIIAVLWLYAASGASGYVVEPRDGVSIRVAGYAEFNTRAVVASDGTILMPLVGEVKAAGLTEEQLMRHVRLELKEYIRGDIKLTISITRAAGHSAAPPPTPPPPSPPPAREHAVRAEIPVDAPTRIEERHETPEGNAYIIEAGDKIDLKVWGYDEFNTNSGVAPDGTITVPLVGEVQVAGLTGDRVRARLRRRLAQYIKGDARLTMSVTPVKTDKGSIKGFNQKKITVLGAILRQDSFPATAEVPLFQLLSFAGGTTPESDLSRITIVRNTRTTFVVNLTRAIEKGTLKSVPKVQPGDTVFIPSKKHRGRQVFTAFTAALSTTTALLFLLRF